MSDPIDDPWHIRRASAPLLARALGDARTRTLDLFAATRAALQDQMDIGYAEELNPPLWELGHVGWFEEFWIARNAERQRGPAARLEAARTAPLRRGADALYDSSRVAHARRWQLPLPDAANTIDDLARIRERTLALLKSSTDSDAALYFFRLALLHEDMHGEAALMIAQCLGLDVADALATVAPAAASARGELALAAATLPPAPDGEGFAFDNELGNGAVEVAAFTIDRTPVPWAAFLPFIEAGGYHDPQWWSATGWSWRTHALPQGLPRHLGRDSHARLGHTVFGRWRELDPEQPAYHLSHHEAQAWCRWAGRRLPSEHEWTLAALRGDADFAWGQVWEWTDSPFVPWPGFAPHPYRDYSQPWFDGRPVLKGGSFATAARLKHPRYRNYFSADRNDVFAGFRSCALDS